MNVLESGEKIYKYFYAHLDEIAWPKYEIKKLGCRMVASENVIDRYWYRIGTA